MWRTKATVLILLLAFAGCAGVPTGGTREERMAAWDQEERKQQRYREGMESDDYWYVTMFCDFLAGLFES